MSFFIELFCVVTLQYQILVRIAIAYFIIEKKKAAPQPWQAIAQRFCSLPVCKTDGIKKCKAGSISLRLFKLKQIEVNNGQKTIDIRPRTRYNISNLIRKQCYHYCIAK